MRPQVVLLRKRGRGLKVQLRRQPGGWKFELGQAYQQVTTN
jgi:hypothetical protein